MDLLIAILKKGSVIMEGNIDKIYYRDNTVIVKLHHGDNWTMKRVDDASIVDATVVTSTVVVLTNVVRVRKYTCQDDTTF